MSIKNITNKSVVLTPAYGRNTFNLNVSHFVNQVKIKVAYDLNITDAVGQFFYGENLSFLHNPKVAFFTAGSRYIVGGAVVYYSQDSDNSQVFKFTSPMRIEGEQSFDLVAGDETLALAGNLCLMLEFSLVE